MLSMEDHCYITYLGPPDPPHITIYAKFLSWNYSKAHVVFDGYAESTTKFVRHQRRSHGKMGVDVSFTGDMNVSQKKDEFLSNNKNKQRFIKMLDEYLLLHDFIVHHSLGDADLLIVRTAVQCAESKDSVLVGKDTDLLVLLCYYTDQSAYDLIMHSQAKSSICLRKVWNIKYMKGHLGCDVCESILFIHAIGGCDTTSRLYGIGKGAPLKKHMSSQIFRENSKLFNMSDAALNQIVEAGEKTLVVLYGGKKVETLNSLKYKNFCDRTASKNTHTQSHSITPTTAAARYLSSWSSKYLLYITFRHKRSFKWHCNRLIRCSPLMR